MKIKNVEKTEQHCKKRAVRINRTSILIDSRINPRVTY